MTQQRKAAARTRAAAKLAHRQEIAERLAQLRREKSARERRDVLQGEIAGEIGIAPETYSRYERAKRDVPEVAVIALAAYFGTTPQFIRYGVAPTPTNGELTAGAIAAALARSTATPVVASPPQPPATHAKGGR